jgi:hypothetical protein
VFRSSLSRAGIKSKDDVIAMGIDKYNEACRSIVMRYSKARRPCSTDAATDPLRHIIKGFDAPRALRALMHAFTRAGVGDDCASRGAVDRL